MNFKKQLKNNKIMKNYLLTVSSSEVGKCIIASFLQHDGLNHRDIIIKRGTTESPHHHV